MKHTKQIVVPPGEVGICPVDLTVHGPGPFEAQINVLLEDKGIRTVPITVKGVGIASGGSKNDGPTS